jgi:hypothetical protein
MPRLLVPLVCVVLLGGCGGKNPPAYAVPEVRRLYGDADRWWEAALRTLGERGFEVERAERAAGIIETRWRILNADYSSTVFVTQGEDRYSDCGKPGVGKTFRGKQARLAMRIASTGDRSIDLSVEAMFRTERAGGFVSASDFLPCRSRGRFEEELLIETQVRMLSGQRHWFRQQGR